MTESESCLKKQLSSQYQILQKLGEGSQGTVYLAENLKTHEKVAIKQLMIQSIKDWKLYDLFHREAETLQRLDVPGVAKLHEARELLNIETPMAIIIQDYIDGEPLQKFIAQGHRFRIEQIGEILYQLLRILEKLHHANPPVIHRDIKPSNIILKYTDNSPTPEVHIIDFGAVSNPQVKGGGSTVVGTYGYMSPEQLMGSATAASDLYSLAIIAVYLMSGVAPENLAIEDFHVLIDPHLEHLPHSITLFLNQMLAPHEDERMTNYETIRQFFDALRTQHFERIPQSNTLIKKNATTYSLNKVTSYRQAGNIDLWNTLSNNTPRKIPSYIHKKICIMLIKNPYFSFLCLIITAMILVGIVCAMNLTGYLEGYAQNTYNLIMIIIIIPFIIGMVFIGKSVDIMSFKSILHLRKFMKAARKSMATIIRVEYIPIYPSLDSRKSTNISFVPTWRLTYSFNPPDDSSPDPLVHTTKTHTIPKNLKEGDLIPILYNIQNRKGNEFVSSLPYPCPTDDELELFTNENENDD